jgi:hypothetical protein
MNSVTTLVSGLPAEVSWLLAAISVVGLTIIVGRGIRLWRAQNQIIAAMDRAAVPAAEHAAMR